MTDTKPTLETDKVLALAREAGLAVTISSHDSLYKFAALIQQQMEADGWRQCAVGQGTTQFCSMAEEFRKDSERRKDAIKWLEDNHPLHTSVEILYVVDGYEVTVMHENGVTPLSKTYRGETLLTAIDQARSANVHK